ncbi:ras-related protein Rab-34-like [Clavelina lepadiformis]|uniref:ras-related protein Rab-34-like n=1 Tax=Clavelina lepadiformis TaxID=159417 RepID=UPI0040420BDF
MAGSVSSSRVMQVHKDRVIARFPEAHTKDARIDLKFDFDPRVRQACANDKVNAVGLKICKMIVIGDVSVGKTSLVNRFCKKAFDADYKATIGVDFEVERFEVLNSPFTLQMWDTAGQERFQCIASAYYRGANIVTIVFDVSDINSLTNATKWLEAARKENTGAEGLLVFLVGTKKDLIAPGAYRDVEKEAIKLAQAMSAEYWAVSSKTGECVKEFFFRVAALAFEGSILREMERRQFSRGAQIGDGNAIKLKNEPSPKYKNTKVSCCKT